MSRCGLALSALAMAYTIIAWLTVRFRRRPGQSWPSVQPPVTVLKPLCGAEHELYESLRTFCDQR
jgi:ceramide glucosyltransferase